MRGGERDGTRQAVQGSSVGKTFGFILRAMDFKHRGGRSDVILVTLKTHPVWRMKGCRVRREQTPTQRQQPRRGDAVVQGEEELHGCRAHRGGRVNILTNGWEVGAEGKGCLRGLV